MLVSKFHLFLALSLLITSMTASLHAIGDDNETIPSKKRKRAEPLDECNLSTLRTSACTAFEDLKRRHGSQYAQQSLSDAIHNLDYSKDWKAYLYTIILSERTIKPTTQSWSMQFVKAMNSIQETLKSKVVPYDPSKIINAREALQNIIDYGGKDYAIKQLQKVLEEFNGERKDKNKNQENIQHWRNYFKDVVINSARSINFLDKEISWVQTFHEGMEHISQELGRITKKDKAFIVLEQPSVLLVPSSTFDHWRYHNSYSN